MHPGYASNVNKLVTAMTEFMREHPEALDLDGPTGLFKLGFKLGELGPRTSYAQGAGAFYEAQRIVRKELQ